MLAKPTIGTRIVDASNPKIELTQALVDKLSFERQPVMRGEKLAWKSTPQGTHDWFLHDTKTSGLRIRLTPSSGTWIVRRKLNGKPVRRAMGSIRTSEAGEFLTLAQARKRAEQWRGMMAAGTDPLDLQHRASEELAHRKGRERLTMGVAFEEYLAARKDKNALNTHKDRLAVQRWMEASPLWRVPVVKLERNDVAHSLGPLLDRAIARQKVEKEFDGNPKKADAKTKAQLKKVKWGPERPGSIDKIYMYCQEAWKRSAVELHIPLPIETPFLAWRKDVKFPESKRRTRWLDTSQDSGKEWVRAIVRLWREAHEMEAAISKPWHAAMLDYYICVMIWGTRLTETAVLRWEQVDEERQVIWLAPESTKTQVLGCVPLTPWIAQILETRKVIRGSWQPHSPYVFPSRVYGKHIVSPQKTLASINKAAGFSISTHDLRRTIATDIAGEKHTLEKSKMILAEAVLQHAQSASGIASATTEAYVLNRAEILRPIYAEREDRLRQIAGLKPLGKKSTKGKDAELDRIVADPAKRKQLLVKLLAADK